MSTKKNEHQSDIVIIGAGPAGLFAIFEAVAVAILLVLSLHRSILVPFIYWQDHRQNFFIPAVLRGGLRAHRPAARARRHHGGLQRRLPPGPRH